MGAQNPGTLLNAGMHALIFDVDGTLIDSVYTHVVSWQKSFAAEGTQVPGWCIHTKIGLSGKNLPWRLDANWESLSRKREPMDWTSVTTPS